MPLRLVRARSLGRIRRGRAIEPASTYLDLNSGLTIFLLDPHFGGDGLVMAIRHRDPNKTWTIGIQAVGAPIGAGAKGWPLTAQR
jgi:hypothetical protein